MAGKKRKSDDTDIMKGQTERFEFFGYTCIGGRDEDQDSLGCTNANGRQVFVVCDGMGGHAGGSQASLTAVTAIVEAFKSFDATLPTDKCLVTATEIANKAIYDKAQSDPHLRNMGTTLTLLVIDEQAAWVTHIGDSRVYQLRGAGQKVFRTFDHSRVFESVAAGHMTEEEARTAPYSNVLSNALGVMPEIEVKVTKLSYKVDDRFVLCCDGVWNTQPEPDVICMMQAHPSPKETCLATKALVEKLGKAAGGHHDNHTMIVIDMKCKSTYSLSIFKKIGRLFVSKKKQIIT